MLAIDDNRSDYFLDCKEEKYPLGNKGQDLEKDQRDSLSKSLDNKSIKNMLFGPTF